MAKTEYRYEFGKRWDARVPRSDLHWYMGHIYVGTSTANIEADIRKRCAKNPAFTPNLIKQSIAYALECHMRNQHLYRKVMG